MLENLSNAELGTRNAELKEKKKSERGARKSERGIIGGGLGLGDQYGS